MNMKVLKPSRKRIKAGDIFAFQMRAGEYRFGRVIRLDAHIGGFHNVILIYIYQTFSTRKEDIPLLDKNHLLVPPVGTNRQAWLKGYFETIRNEPLKPEDILKRHCFRDLAGRDRYWDDDENELPQRMEPCGLYGLGSYRTIDEAVSEALGIPLSPD